MPRAVSYLNPLVLVTPLGWNVLGEKDKKYSLEFFRMFENMGKSVGSLFTRFAVVWNSHGTIKHSPDHRFADNPKTEILCFVQVSSPTAASTSAGKKSSLVRSVS